MESSIASQRVRAESIGKFAGIAQLCLAGLLVLPVGGQCARAQEQSPVVAIAVDTSAVTVTPGEEFTVKIQVKIAAGWHINSNRPSEEGFIPCSVAATGDEISLARVDYPPAENLRLEFAENALSVFEGTCQFAVTLIADRATRKTQTAVDIVLSYQACNDQTCLPPGTTSTPLLVYYRKAGTLPARPRAR